MNRNLCIAVFTVATFWLSHQAFSQETLLTDDFTVTSNSQDVNQELGLRQTGPLSPFTYTSLGSQHQVGNDETDVGQPGGVSNSNYLLLAFNSGFYSDLEIDATLARGGPLTIAFDMYVTGNPQGDAADKWGAFTLRGPGDPWPVANSGEFGMLMRNDGRIQMFQNSDPANPAWDVNGYSSNSRWELTFSDPNGTGSAFNGNGSLLTFTNGANTESVALNQLNSSGLRLGFRQIDEMFIGIDNLEIIGDPLQVPGDADGDGDVDLVDFGIIRDNFFTTPAVAGTSGDTNFDGVVNSKDFREWTDNYVPTTVAAATVVPEPATITLVSLVCVVACSARRRG